MSEAIYLNNTEMNSVAAQRDLRRGLLGKKRASLPYSKLAKPKDKSTFVNVIETVARDRAYETVSFQDRYKLPLFAGRTILIGAYNFSPDSSHAKFKQEDVLAIVQD